MQILLDKEVAEETKPDEAAPSPSPPSPPPPPPPPPPPDTIPPKDDVPEKICEPEQEVTSPVVTSTIDSPTISAPEEEERTETESPLLESAPSVAVSAQEPEIPKEEKVEEPAEIPIESPKEDIKPIEELITQQSAISQVPAVPTVPTLPTVPTQPVKDIQPSTFSADLTPILNSPNPQVDIIPPAIVSPAVNSPTSTPNQLPIIRPTVTPSYAPLPPYSDLQGPTSNLGMRIGNPYDVQLNQVGEAPALIGAGLHSYKPPSIPQRPAVTRKYSHLSAEEQKVLLKIMPTEMNREAPSQQAPTEPVIAPPSLPPTLLPIDTPESKPKEAELLLNEKDIKKEPEPEPERVMEPEPEVDDDSESERLVIAESKTDCQTNPENLPLCNINEVPKSQSNRGGKVSSRGRTLIPNQKAKDYDDVIGQNRKAEIEEEKIEDKKPSLRGRGGRGTPKGPGRARRPSKVSYSEEQPAPKSLRRSTRSTVIQEQQPDRRITRQVAMCGRTTESEMTTRRRKPSTQTSSVAPSTPQKTIIKDEKDAKDAFAFTEEDEDSPNEYQRPLRKRKPPPISKEITPSEKKPPQPIEEVPDEKPIVTPAPVIITSVPPSTTSASVSSSSGPKTHHMPLKMAWKNKLIMEQIQNEFKLNDEDPKSNKRNQEDKDKNNEKEIEDHVNTKLVNDEQKVKMEGVLQQAGHPQRAGDIKTSPPPLKSVSFLNIYYQLAL